MGAFTLLHPEHSRLANSFRISMPTDDDVNALLPDAQAQQEAPVLTDEVITSHPKYKELEEKHAAARKGMDSSNLTKKELQAEVARLKVMAGEEKEPELTDEPQTVTKKELQEQIWELKHSSDVELYGDDEFKKDIETGIPRDYALKTAKLRFQSNPDKARLSRQQTMASGPAMGTRNLDGDELTATEQKGIADGLYTKETALKYRQIQKERGR